MATSIHKESLGFVGYVTSELTDGQVQYCCGLFVSSAVPRAECRATRGRRQRQRPSVVDWASSMEYRWVCTRNVSVCEDACGLTCMAERSIGAGGTFAAAADMTNVGSSRCHSCKFICSSGVEARRRDTDAMRIVQPTCLSRETAPCIPIHTTHLNWLRLT